MPTVQQIINKVDRIYENNETNANKVYDLDRLHKRIFVKMQALKNTEEIYSDVTIADQLTYTLPSNCRIEDITLLEVSEEVITSSNATTVTWNTFEYSSKIRDVSSGYWYGKATNTTYALVIDGEPIDTSDLSIRIYFNERPTTFTSADMTVTPDLDEDYHDLLVWGLAQELASQGPNPDTEIADYYQTKYNEFLQEVMESLAVRDDKAPNEEERLEDRW